LIEDTAQAKDGDQGVGPGCDGTIIHGHYSHSIVAGGLLEIS